MFDWRSANEWRQVLRYYQAGIVNTLFGYALFAALVAIDLNMFVAQAVSHVLGTAFNYFTYSRHAFRGRAASKWRFVLSYAVNYVLGLLALAISAPLLGPYVGGLAAIVFVSIVNYFVLKRLVFLGAS